MSKKQKNTDEESKKPDCFSDLMNKVVVCEALNGKTITGILTGSTKYELLLLEAKTCIVNKISDLDNSLYT